MEFVCGGCFLCGVVGFSVVGLLNFGWCLSVGDCGVGGV